MEQLHGFEVTGKENLVCQLQKSLYGLKQTPSVTDKTKKVPHRKRDGRVLGL